MVHSFLMAGQSNMAGRGFMYETEAIEDSRLKMLRNGRWLPMTEPINYDRPFSGVSLAASFALDYALDHQNTDVGLIPCADGGSSLDDWAVGGLLYDHAVLQARLAQRTSEIKGILWHQGEADCEPDKAALYGEKFTAMMNEMLNELKLTDVPVLLGGLGDYLAFCPQSAHLHHYKEVNAALMRIAGTTPGYYYVSARGLTCNPDFLHFNSASLREFGHRYYQVLSSGKSLPDELVSLWPANGRLP